VLQAGCRRVVGPPVVVAFVLQAGCRRVVGWLSDATGSYDVAFYGAGVTIFVSGLMLFPAPCIGRRAAASDTHDCCCGGVP